MHPSSFPLIFIENLESKTPAMFVQKLVEHPVKNNIIRTIVRKIEIT